MQPTVGIILAAGVGSRLRPLTDDRPKCLVSLGDETIVARAVRILHAAGVSRLVVSTGYLAESLREALAGAPLEVAYVDNADYATTQNVVSLARALRELRAGEAFLKLDGDVVFAPAVITGLLSHRAPAVVAVDRAGTLGAEEMKVLVEGDRVVRFGKGLDPARAHGESIGVEYFDAATAPVVSAAIARAVAAGRTDVYYEDVYNDALAGPNAVAMQAYEVQPGDWTEVDTVEDLGRARTMFAHRASPGV